MEANDQLAIRFDSPIATSATLFLDFSYKLVHKDTGFHLTPYTATDGSQILLGATHMQARTFLSVSNFLARQHDTLELSCSAMAAPACEQCP